jgi:DNA-binding transcriptional ArsR family regulator
MDIGGIMEPAVRQEIEILHQQVCMALGDPIRLMIIVTLADKAKCVNDLVEELALPQPTISRHLRVLRERSLVLTNRQGSSIFYSLADDRLIQVIDLLRGVLRDRVLKQARLIDIRPLIDAP